MGYVSSQEDMMHIIHFYIQDKHILKEYKNGVHNGYKVDPPTIDIDGVTRTPKK